MTDANPGDEITSALFNTKFDRNGGQTFTGNFIPDGDGTRDLGSSGAKWKDLYLSGASIHFGTDILGIGSGSLQYKGNTIMNSSGKLDATALLGNLPALNGGSLTSLTKTQVGLSAVPNTDFTTPVGTNTTHRGLSNNPHTVSKTQVGLSAVPNTDFTSPVGLNTTHRGSSSNPHTVTKSQVSLGNVPNTDFTTSVGLNTTHRGLTNNPHSVDKADVGLSNVPNTDFTTSVGLNTTHRGLTNNPHSVDKTDVSLGNVPNTDATNASNIGTGTLADARLTSNVTLEGNTFNGASQLVKMTSATKLPAVDGSLLTGIATTPADGSITVPKLSASNATSTALTSVEDTTNLSPSGEGMIWEISRIAAKYVGFSGTITGLGFVIRAIGTAPSGNLSFVVRSVSGDTILGSKVWGNANTVTSSYTLLEVTFDTPIVISSSTDIYLSVEEQNAPVSGYPGLQVGTDDGSNTGADYTWDGSWNNHSGWYIGFKLTTQSGENWSFGLNNNEVTETSQTAKVQNAYIVNNASQVTITLPTTCALGDIVKIIGKGAGGWKVAPGAGDSILYAGLATGWSAGGNVSTAREFLAGCGTLTAGLCFGGDTSGGGAYSAVTEEYNGTAWSGGGALSTARRQLSGAGTQSAGLSFGGNYTAVFYATTTEEYNGTAWSGGGALATGNRESAGFGTQTAGVCAGGIAGSMNVTQLYNGTSWSGSGNLSTGRYDPAGFGTQSAGLVTGGDDEGDAPLSSTEEFNGSTWSAGGALPATREYPQGAGTQTDGVVFGGYLAGYKGETYTYNGTAWSTSSATLSISRYLHASAGVANSALCISGRYSGGRTTSTEEFASASDITSDDFRDTIELTCITANSLWNVTGKVGSF